MSGALAGRVALVTGSGSAVGRAIALALGAEGAGVAVNVRRDESAGRELVEEIVQRGGQALCVVADVRSRDEVKRLTDAVSRTLGDVTLLVHNATPRRVSIPFDELDEDDWQDLLRTIVLGGMYVTQAVLPGMRAAGFGRVVFMSGLASVPVLPLGGYVHVAAVKGAVEAMARALAVAVGAEGVSVNVVSPGLMDAAGRDASVTAHQASLEPLLSTTVTGRRSTPAQIAAACRFLCSEEASNITGQVIHCNGGMYFGR